MKKVMMYRFKTAGSVGKWYPVTGLSSLNIEIADYLDVRGDNCIEIRFIEPGSEYDTTDIVDGRDHLDPLDQEDLPEARQ